MLFEKMEKYRKTRNILGTFSGRCASNKRNEAPEAFVILTKVSERKRKKYNKKVEEKTMKNLSVFLALTLIFSLFVPAFAASA